jgi:hypothetical protein
MSPSQAVQLVVTLSAEMSGTETVDWQCDIHVKARRKSDIRHVERRLVELAIHALQNYAENELEP